MGEGNLKPRSLGLAPRRPFSTASVALKARTLIEFTMSSMRAYKQSVCLEQWRGRGEQTVGRYVKCSVNSVTSEVVEDAIIPRSMVSSPKHTFHGLRIAS